MKTVLVCPNQASGLTVLADSRPLATLPVLGEAFISYWMQHLAMKNYKDVLVLTPEAPEQLEALLGSGARWGLRVNIAQELRELSPEEVRLHYRADGDNVDDFDVLEANHLPGLPEEMLFRSYGAWFSAIKRWMISVTQQNRIGVRELAPGIWCGRRTRIARTARLVAPCWIGNHVQIGKNSVVGPNSFLEDQVVIEAGCAVENSWIGPETFLGTLTELKNSLGWGNRLINWQTGSHAVVPDPFLMTSLSDKQERPPSQAQPSRASEPVLSRRIENVMSLAQKLQS